MRHKDIDWKELRGSITIFVICTVVSGILLYTSHYFQKQMKQEFASNDARFRSISQRYLDVDEEERLINEYFPRFVDLYNSGVIGKEQRLNWIEILRSTAKEMKLPRLNYQVETQKTYTPGYSVDSGSFSIYSSKMNLQMDLLHEGDLFTIFESLNEKAKGMYSPVACDLRSSGKITEQARAPNINATCELRWYTIRLAGGKEITI